MAPVPTALCSGPEARASLALDLATHRSVLPALTNQHTPPMPVSHSAPVATALAPASSDSEAGFDAAWLDKRSSIFARWLLRRVSSQRIVTQRRAHYTALQAGVDGLAGARPLHAALPDGACPWMFPLVVDDADAVFARLHREGVPLTRFAETLWNGVDAAVCPNAVFLARHVLAFPCHQELDQQELDWMIARIRAALRP